MDYVDKKSAKLGMHASTAQGRLVKDILFSFLVKEGHKCFRCGGELTRDTFSIEHKVAWFDSEAPSESFFDLKNIAFSHMSCNYSNTSRTGKVTTPHGSTNRYKKHGCRCKLCVERQRLDQQKYRANKAA